MIHSPKFSENQKVPFWGPVGSNGGPCMVLDPMELRSCVPRVPWNVCFGLVCINITDTADFRGEDDSPTPLIDSFENTLGL